VTFDFVLDYGWANTSAFVLCSSVETLEDPEKFIGITLIRADTVILYGADGFVGGRAQMMRAIFHS
jgi:hypothetical protein